MEQRASSLQQRLEARRNMFFQKEQQQGAQPTATTPSFLSSRSGKDHLKGTILKKKS